MKVVKESGSMTKEARYCLTSRYAHTSKMTDAIGETLAVSAWVLIEKEDGTQVLGVMDKTGEAYSTISKTFIESFCDIVDTFGAADFVKVVAAQSKKGRSYIYALPDMLRGAEVC